MKEKLLKAAEIKQSSITNKPETKTMRVIFENITQDEITSSAKKSSGSGEPTQIDMETWKEIICSKSYGAHSHKLADKIAKLADKIATLARRLVTEIIPHDHISSLLACRLVPQKKKDNGIRPVSVGECLCRIIGKTITRLLTDDIIHSARTLQIYARLESGIEAAICSVRSFKDQNSECLLLADADNAFSKLNRKVSLANIKRLHPTMYTYLHNSYNTPDMQYLEYGDHILSRQGEI